MTLRAKLRQWRIKLGLWIAGKETRDLIGTVVAMEEARRKAAASNGRIKIVSNRIIRPNRAARRRGRA